MARPRSFDTEAVARAARQVFWARGFEATSLPDLEAATGLGRSSLYQAFGSKRGLFDAAVASYLDEVVHPLLADLEPQADSPVAPTALADYLGRLAAALAGQCRSEGVTQTSQEAARPPAPENARHAEDPQRAPRENHPPDGAPSPRPRPYEVSRGRTGARLPAPQGCLLINASTSPIGEDPLIAATVADYRRELRAAVARGLAAVRPGSLPRTATIAPAPSSPDTAASTETTDAAGTTGTADRRSGHRRQHGEGAADAAGTPAPAATRDATGTTDATAEAITALVVAAFALSRTAPTAAQESLAAAIALTEQAG